MNSVCFSQTEYVFSGITAQFLDAFLVRYYVSAINTRVGILQLKRLALKYQKIEFTRRRIDTSSPNLLNFVK